MEKTFIDKCINGEVDAIDIDHFVDEWHDGDDPRSLKEFLGMGDIEYALWVEKPAAIKLILFSRRFGLDLPDAIQVNNKELDLAARSSVPEQADNLIEWLRQTGRIK